MRFLFFLTVLICLKPISSWAFNITIDPGHGGTDKGAVKNSAQESKVVLNIALELEKLLQQDPDFNISYTRKEDKALSLQERVNIAEGFHSDLFVSLHANSVQDSRANGIELFFQNSLPPDEESLYLAHLEDQLNHKPDQESNSSLLSKENDIKVILEDLKREQKIRKSLNFNQILSKDLKANNLHIKQAPFFVVSKTSMPSVLIEVGFLTNRSEAKKLLTASYQKEIALQIYNSIKSYSLRFPGVRSEIKEKQSTTQFSPLNSTQLLSTDAESKNLEKKLTSEAQTSKHSSDN